MKQKRAVIWALLVLLAIGVFVFSAYQLITQYRIYDKAEKEYQSIGRIARAQEENRGEENQGGIDFGALAAINPDIVAWMVVEGTPIDYPVVQGKDNDVYLHTTFQKESNGSGAIFSDFRNAPDFTGLNSVVYGHNMKDGSMFAELMNYREQAYYEKHRSFLLYTPDATYTCEIFSAYLTTAESEAYTLDFPDSARFAEYLDGAVAHSLVQTGIMPGSLDKTVTLSTCDNQTDDARMVVHARLVEQQ